MLARMLSHTRVDKLQPCFLTVPGRMTSYSSTIRLGKGWPTICPEPPQNGVLYSDRRLHGKARLQVNSKAQPLLLTFRRNCVVDYGQLPGSVALYPHMSESKDARWTGLKGDFWIPRIDACELERLRSGNNYGVTKVAYHNVAPVKRGNLRLPRPQQGCQWPEVLFEPSLLVLNVSRYIGLKIIPRHELRQLRFVAGDKRLISFRESSKHFSLGGGLPSRSLNQTTQNCAHEQHMKAVCRPHNRDLLRR